MNPATFDRPFFEVTLPLMLTIIAGVWAMVSTNNRRLDDLHASFNRRLDEVNVSFNRRLDDLNLSLNRRLDEVVQRLDAIEARLLRIEEILGRHETRITVLEERTNPLRGVR